jgi:hypothetical protein
MTQPTKPPFADPAKAWRDWFVQSERDWSQALTGMMQDENVMRTMGQEITAGLYRQEMLSQGMAGNLAMMNLPTRQEIMALGERIGRLEDAVARVEAAITRTAPAAAARPARTRKAPAPPRKAPARVRKAA